jgi:hypothetical protein
VRELEERVHDPRARIDNLEAARRPLLEMGKLFPREDFPDLCRAADAALAVLASAIKRNEI